MIKKFFTRENFNKAIALFYVAIIVLFTVVYFTNDYSLTDIKKTSIVVGLGIDIVDQNVKVTAQIAIPKASENGESTTFTQIDGQGKTVGGAIKQINGKVGFYPKLTFCKVILLGDSCQTANLFELLNYFYRNDYTHLTPIVAMCSGEASELLSQKLPFGDTGTASVERLLSDESKRTGNVSTVNLKCLGLMQYSQSKACYMPYIDYISAPIGEEGSSGGDQNGSSGGQNGQSGQGEQSGGGSSGGGQSEQSNQGGEYSCTRTAMFKDGEFAGVLDEEQAFALNLLRNDIRHAFIECVADGANYALGIRSCSGNIKLSFDGDTPVLTVSFNGFAQLQDQDGEQSVKRDAKKVVSSNYLSGGEDVLKGYFNSLIDQMRATNCDVLGVNKLLYRFNYSRYNAHHSTLLASMSVRYNITLSSAA